MSNCKDVTFKHFVNIYRKILDEFSEYVDKYYIRRARAPKEYRYIINYSLMDDPEAGWNFQGGNVYENTA